MGLRAFIGAHNAGPTSSTITTSITIEAHNAGPTSSTDTTSITIEDHNVGPSCIQTQYFGG